MKLKKDLTLLHVFCIATGAMISSGIFVLPGLAHSRAGTAVVFSYLIAGVLAGAGLLSIAELITAMPKPGGDYFYISRGLGPAAGTVAGLLSWFGLSVKSAFALIGLAVLIESWVPVNWHVIAATLGLVFLALNLVGTRESATFQTVLAIVLVILMTAFAVGGLFHINAAHFRPVLPHGIGSVFATAGFVFISYGGLINVASMAGEVKDPGRIIPRAMIWALVLMLGLYGVTIVTVTGVLDRAALDQSLKPISDAAAATWGTPGYVVVSLAASLAFVTTANAGMLTASRYLLALSRDELLPAGFSRVSRRFHTPYVAILVTGLTVLAAVFVRLEILAESASVVFVLSYILGSVSVMVLRESNVQNYRPSFRAPFYPWLQAGTILALLFVLVEMGEHAFAATGAMMAVGFLIYWGYGRPRLKREYALLNLIERVTSRELVTGRLESELKDIVLERDAIVRDTVDHAIENAIVIDVDGPLELAAFFDLAAQKLAPKLARNGDAVRQALLEREQSAGTVLHRYAAVPQLVIEAEAGFEMLIARCREGVAFSPRQPGVTAVFVLVSSPPQRMLHLRVLSAIAHIVESPDFEKSWLEAGNKQALKDVILLAQRQRPPVAAAHRSMPDRSRRLAE